MRIGILLTCYNCADYVDDCLAPWINLKEKFNFIIACNSGMFRDYFDLGISENNQETLEKLIKHKLDFLVTTSGRNLLDEDSSRNLCLDFLVKQDCDLLIYLDGDEIYTEDQIIRVLDFVQTNPSFDQYGIFFKNHTIKKGLFLNNFLRKSIYWMKRYGGIQRFYFDSDFVYNDPNADYSNTVAIPREVAFIEHYSWISDDPRTKIKITYQNRRYVGASGDFPENMRCAFRWNEQRDFLEFNPDFWENNGRVQVPMLREKIGESYCLDFELDFDRKQNIITVSSFNCTGDYEFSIFDNHQNHVYTSFMSLYPQVNYWIAPSPNRNFDREEGLNFLEILVKKEGSEIHRERLHFRS